MAVYALIPVFNRLALTREVLRCLRAQQLDESLQIIVIDDGSTDGTAEWLAQFEDITVLKGDGSLWWAGAIELGLQHVLRTGGGGDWVLFVNNDTIFEKNFISQLLQLAHFAAPAVVGSVICDSKEPERLLSIGPLVDAWKLKISDKLEHPRARDKNAGPHLVHALSGRGTLYPISALKTVGTMRPHLLPHYLADYELAVRTRKAGYKLLVSEDAVVFSDDEFGNSYRAPNFWRIFFEVRSPYYLPAVLVFWWGSSTFSERLTLIPRLVYKTLKSRNFFGFHQG